MYACRTNVAAMCHANPALCQLGGVTSGDYPSCQRPEQLSKVLLFMTLPERERNFPLASKREQLK